MASASSTVCPSMPGAPLLRTTLSSARARLASDATSSSSRLVSAAQATVRADRLRFALCSRNARPLGCVRRPIAPAPVRAVGEHEAQLTVTRPSQPISPFAPRALPRFIAPTKRSDFWAGVGWSSLPPSGLPLHRGPVQTSPGKNTGCPAAAAPITAPASVGFWASRSKARSPGWTGLPRSSLAFGAAVRLGLLPHTASRRQHRASHDGPCCVQLPPAHGCYQLAP